MNGKQLKNSILQWAIQGKLVPQDPNDEPASVLLEKIRQEKERLIKEKKIKRDKNASIIFRGEDNSYYEKVLATGEVKCVDEEIPFDVPKGWEWCRFTNCINISTNLVDPKDYQDHIHVSPDRIEKGTGKLLDCQSVKYDNVKSNNHMFHPGQIIYSKIRPLLRKAVIVNFEGLCSADMYPLDTNLYSYFVLLVLLSDTFNSQVALRIGTRVKMPKINQEEISQILIPVPPFAEQQRIVSKLQELEPFIERYGKSEEALGELNATINDLLKKSILQEAIQGKLVPQTESEGTAAELLQQIKQEKQRLVKEGKLKKSALTDSVIYKGDDNRYWEKIGKETRCIDDEIPFEIPSSWSWIRGKHAFLPMESIKPKNDFIYIDVDAVNNKLNIIDKPKMILAGNAPSRATRKLHKNDILFSMVRPYLKNVALVPDEFEEAVASTGFYVIIPSVGYHPQFLLHLMLSNYVVDGLNSFMKGDNSPSINNCHIENYLYPLPPLAEQHRIVAQIEKLFEQLR